MNLIEGQHLSYCYDPDGPFKKQALADVSFQLASNQILAILGQTGSGKSTLIRHLNGLLKADEGRILLKGHDIWAHGKLGRSVVFDVGLVFQYPENQLFGATAQEDLAYGLKNMALPDQEIKERISSALQWVDLPESVLKENPMILSGGQMRRLAIASVIAMQPAVLVLDEPTAGLDPKSSRQILDLLDRYRQQPDRSVIFVSHSMEEAAAYADWILVMRAGRLLLSDEKNALFREKNLPLLQEASLDLPVLQKIAAKLRKDGFAISDRVFQSADQLAKEIMTDYRQGSNE